MSEPLRLRDIALFDLESELLATREVLERLPTAWFDEPTQAGSWTLGQLARHTVEVLFWLRTVLEADRFDVASRPDPARDAVHDGPTLLARFDELAGAVRAAAAELPDEALGAPWSLVHGETVLRTTPRHVALRRACLSHLVHHRAQLGVHLRRRGVTVPETYPG